MHKFFFKKKKGGYILLLMMLLITSIFLLATSSFLKNRISNTVIRTTYKKHLDNIFLANAISIIKGILAQDGDLFKENKSELFKNNNENEKNKSEKKATLLYFFYLYWLHGNKWLEFNIKGDLYSQDAKIMIYLQFEDGKFPLQKVYSEYKKEETKKNNNTNKIEKKDESSAKDDKKNNAEETGKNENNEEKESIISKNAFLSSIKKMLAIINEKSSIIKSILKKINKTEEKEGLWKLINNTLSTSSTYEIFSFHQYQKMTNESIYGNLVKNNEEDLKKKNKAKETGISDIFSLNNSKCSLFYLSQEFLELFCDKEFVLSSEKRKEIIDIGKKYFEKGNKEESISVQDLWKSLFEKVFHASLPKDILEKKELLELFSTQIDLPVTIRSFIKIEMNDQTFFAIAIFKKNKKYDTSNEDSLKNNKEYLLQSIYTLS